MSCKSLFRFREEARTPPFITPIRRERIRRTSLSLQKPELAGRNPELGKSVFEPPGGSKDAFHRRGGEWLERTLVESRFKRKGKVTPVRKEEWEDGKRNVHALVT